MVSEQPIDQTVHVIIREIESRIKGTDKTALTPCPERCQRSIFKSLVGQFVAILPQSIAVSGS
jgi:hypothetical protein